MKPSAARRLFGALVISLAAAVATTLCVFVAAYILFPLEGIEVSGAETYPKSEAENLISDDSSLLTLNSRMLKREIKSNPWVESVQVRKEWRSGIVLVEVKERRPILDGEIEGRRVILSGDGAELPGLGGVELNRIELERDQVSEILNAARTFEEHGVSFGSVDSVGPGGVEATVEGRSIIFSGDVESEQALALEDVMEENPGASVFDLRAPGRVVVGASDDGVEESEG